MSLKAAAAAWRKIAADERKGAEIEARYGDVSSYHIRANNAERCARALEIQDETGIAVCTCCHKPLGEGMKHMVYFH